MYVWLLKRTAFSVLTLLAISMIVFSLVRLTGDPVLLFLPPDAPEEEVIRLREELGFNDSLVVQYGRFLRSALAGDVGFSLKHQEPALRVVLQRLPATLELATASMGLTLAIALPAGILSALWRNSWLDRLVMGGVVVGQSMPTYWVGIMLILLVSVQAELLPPFGRGTVAHLVMPSLTLALFFTARIARLTRSGMLNVLRTDYVRTARAKGLAGHVVVLKHALRNAALPIVTIIGIEFGTLLGGTVITETVFAWPGLGRLAVDAIYARDYPVVQTVVLLVSALFVSINFVVDLLYRVIDPRVELA
jgi:ABC-type dipeptide/oligopeptide/nickel transport system permease component